MLLVATDPDGLRRAWSVLGEAATETLERSYLQTLRLVYATDRWISALVLEDSQPFHPLGIPNPPHDALPPGMFDVGARPTLEEVLIALRDRMDRVKQYLATVSEEQLDREVVSPNGEKTSIKRCFHVVFKKEWWHDQYAISDLGARSSRRNTGWKTALGLYAAVPATAAGWPSGSADCQYCRCGGVVGRNGHEVHLAVSVNLVDADHGPEPLSASYNNSAGHDLGRVGGIGEQGPPAALVVLGVQICS